MDMPTYRIAVVGLGYVGLPLAVEFGKRYSVVGFDINGKRVDELRNGTDSTLEVDELVLKKTLKASPAGAEAGLFCSSKSEDIRDCNFYIITVPTPVDEDNRPDFTPLYKASETVGTMLKKGDIVVYESTVYPGATEDKCVPVLEKNSGLIFNTDFYCGYSPERVNPGDKLHTISQIKKVTSGSTPLTADEVDRVYASVITAGTFKAQSIKIAEASKVVENSQRDINIAFVNELSKIFNLLGIDTEQVLEASATKWNFLPFKPGLVGGHCISVDPYYLVQKAQEAGYNPEVILAGRRLNNSMGGYVVNEVKKLIEKKNNAVDGASVLMLGITFKENCPDIRNTRVADMIKEFKSLNMSVTVFDPWADPDEVLHEYGIETVAKLPEGVRYDSIILAVAHKEFQNIDWRKYAKEKGIIYDVKGILDVNMIDARL